MISSDTPSNNRPFDPGEEASAEVYAGNPIFNFRTLVFFGFVCFLVIITRDGGALSPQQNWVLLVSGTVGAYLFTGVQMFYFKVSDHQLMVRNHYFPWIRWTYEVKELEKMAIRYYFRTGIGLTFRPVNRALFRIFLASSLRNETWKALAERLEKSGITVRTEFELG
jgi:hypothetical protein